MTSTPASSRSPRPVNIIDLEQRDRSGQKKRGSGGSLPGPDADHPVHGAGGRNLALTHEDLAAAGRSMMYRS